MTHKLAATPPATCSQCNPLSTHHEATRTFDATCGRSPDDRLSSNTLPRTNNVPNTALSPIRVLLTARVANSNASVESTTTAVLDADVSAGHLWPPARNST